MPAVPIDEGAILEALKVVRDPDLNRDIVSLGFIRGLRIDGDRVAFTIELTTPACPVKDQMRDQARAAVLRVPGVASVDVQMSAKVREAVGGEGPRQPLPGVKNIIAVGAGKGVVGKTTVAVNLALALAQCGSKVGIVDGDVYGPNVPIMLGINTQLTTDGQKIVPAVRYGLQVISMGFLTSEDAPIIWRGPMLHGALQQFFREVRWAELDYLIIDMPPGIGDEALDVMRFIPQSEYLVVTTPSKVAMGAVSKLLVLLKELKKPVLGVLENMAMNDSPYIQKEVQSLGLPYLGKVRFDEELEEAIGEPDALTVTVFMKELERIFKRIHL